MIDPFTHFVWLEVVNVKSAPTIVKAFVPDAACAAEFRCRPSRLVPLFVALLRELGFGLSLCGTTGRSARVVHTQKLEAPRRGVTTRSLPARCLGVRPRAVAHSCPRASRSNTTTVTTARLVLCTFSEAPRSRSLCELLTSPTP